MQIQIARMTNKLKLQKIVWFLHERDGSLNRFLNYFSFFFSTSTKKCRFNFMTLCLRQKVFPFRLTELFLFWPYYTEGYDKSINCENFDL